jgi:membrane protein
MATRDVLARTVREFRDDSLMDRAAALTYYAVLSIFPGLVVLVALLGLLGSHPETTDALLGIVDRLGPSSAAETLEQPIREVIEDKGGASALLGFGLLGSLWTASGYIGAFTRASNVIYEVEEGRPFWKRRPLQVAMTIAFVCLLALVVIALVVTGPLAEAIGDAIGVGDDALALWKVVKWPLVLLGLMAVLAALYHLAPNVRQRRFRVISPGGAAAVLVWAAASAGFSLYVSHFGSYGATYGTLGGVITFLVWLWLSNLALLLGLELDAELERERELRAGVPAAEERIRLPPREPAPRR